MARTHREIAEHHGVTIDVVKKLSSKGVNVYDDKTVKAELAKKRHRIKPGAELSKGAANSIDEGMTVDQIRAAGMRATNIDDLKILDSKATLLQKTIKVEKEQGKLIPLDEINERDTRIGAAVGAAGAKIVNDWAPELTGLSEPDMQEVMAKRWAEIAAMLAEKQSEFWKGKERP